MYSLPVTTAERGVVSAFWAFPSAVQSAQWSSAFYCFYCIVSVLINNIHSFMLRFGIARDLDKYAETSFEWYAAAGVTLVDFDECFAGPREYPLSRKAQLHLKSQTSHRQFLLFLIFFVKHITSCWQRGIVISSVRRMNEVNPHRACYYLD